MKDNTFKHICTFPKFGQVMVATFIFHIYNLSMANETEIRLLPPELCNQIAAGEVVERPASVLKELVENSIDAGATRIDCRLDNGGQSLILVQDNGSGIAAGNLELAITRHATSKIATMDDLDNILTYGFRGEALPSIASVSRFRISSRAANDPDSPAQTLEVEFGSNPIARMSSLAKGTSVEVRDLFANMPGRLKFLKAPATELKRAQNWFYRLALAHPHIAFTLMAGERQIASFAVNQDLRTRLGLIWPHDLVEDLVPVSAEMHGMKISGLAAPPHLSQQRPDRILFYVNNRAVNDKRLLSAVKEAYKGRLISRDYPLAVLFVEIGPQEVDVNAHPAKTEIRFRNESAIFSAVLGALGKAFDSPSYTQAPAGFWGQVDKNPVFPSPPPIKDKGEWLAQAPEEPRYFTETYESANETQPNLREEFAEYVPPFASERLPAASELEYLGQVANTYLVCRDRQFRLVLVDQHAAHERVIHQRLVEGAFRNSSRPLLEPQIIHLQAEEHARCLELLPKLENLGFKLQLSSNMVKILAIPEILGRNESRAFLADSLKDLGNNPEGILAGMACKAAIKAGQKLSVDEAVELLRQWEATPGAEFCPHGRPCVLKWDESSLEKMFKRK